MISSYKKCRYDTVAENAIWFLIWIGLCVRNYHINRCRRNSIINWKRLLLNLFWRIRKTMKSLLFNFAYVNVLISVCSPARTFWIFCFLLPGCAPWLTAIKNYARTGRDPVMRAPKTKKSISSDRATNRKVGRESLQMN